MAAGPRISVEGPIGKGATTYESRLNRFAENMEDRVAAGMFVMAGIAEYHDRVWGRGIVDTDSTAERWPDTPGPLENTERLRRSMTAKLHAEDSIRRSTPEGFEFGTKVPYAGYLQRGTRKMDRKKFMVQSHVLRAIVGKLMRDFMYKGVTHDVEV